MTQASPLLDVRDLTVSFLTRDGLVRAVDGVSFTLREREVLGIVGESGSGKSVTMMTVMRLLNDPNARFEGQVIYKGRDLMKLANNEMREVRGSEIAMIFQDPMTSLNPVYRVGWQIAEQIRAHEDIPHKAARGQAIELLAAVGIPNPEERVDDYPHKFSGGMRQRVMIAMALSCNPDLLIADEPTTALDVTIQAEILELIGQLKEEFGSAVVLITHDMGVVADIADRVAVMYAGRFVEQGMKHELFYDPQHPYTWGLLGSIPRLDHPKKDRLTAIPGVPPSLINLPGGCAFRRRCAYRFERCMERPDLVDKLGNGHLDACHLEPERKRHLGAAARPSHAAGGLVAAEAAEDQVLVRVEHVKKYFPIKKGIVSREVARVHAVDDVSLEVRDGETLGLVGESGCGKSTLGRCIVRLHDLTDGSVSFRGQDISRMSPRQLRPLRREMQIVFQDPYASLNPRKRVGRLIADPLRIHGNGDRQQIKRRVQELLELVGLSPEHYNRYPHEFSGGQLQRIGVARALALQPRLIIADEPVSSLDVSIQAQVLNLLDDLQDEFKLTYLFIAHDLGVVRHVSDRIAVMYLGKIVEVSPAEELYRHPIHPYTEALMSAVPIPDPELSAQREQIVLKGDPPSPIVPPSGCRFHPRCKYATEICSEVEPALEPQGSPNRLAACHHPLIAEASPKVP